MPTDDNVYMPEDVEEPSISALDDTFACLQLARCHRKSLISQVITSESANLLSLVVTSCLPSSTQIAMTLVSLVRVPVVQTYVMRAAPPVMVLALL